MPDWTYRTVLRPILFAASPTAARDFALGCMGTLARFPWGPKVIDLMGHMRADPRLACSIGGVEFPGRVGLGPAVDPQLKATPALARFGIGFLEFGPLTVAPVPAGPISRDLSAESHTFDQPAENPGLSTTVACLRRLPNVRVFVRLSPEDLSEANAQAIIDQTAPLAAGYILQVRSPATAAPAIARAAEAVKRRASRLVLVAFSMDVAGGVPSFDALGATIADWIDSHNVDGIALDNRRLDDAGRATLGRPQAGTVEADVRCWRAGLPGGAVLLCSGAVYEPGDAVSLLEAGADLVSADGGLVFTGPGLVKRSNEALLYRMPLPAENHRPLSRLSWFWSLLMGLAMFFGGLLAWAVANTRVVMPYDEMTSGLTREQLAGINPRLLHFMAHDRVTLSGTMLAIGILYAVLSYCGSRRGMHWAHVAIVVSASTGFASFFLFLGFGYFDPFHAFVTAVLFQVLLMAVHSDLPAYQAAIAPELTNDRAWLRSQWGQLIFILHGATIIAAGIVICSVGLTSVFVHEDLEFMNTTAEQLRTAHPSLVPLVAHDRATWGGMLLSTGSCVLLSSLWGFRRGNAWLWWALVAAGTTAYAATIAIHWDVGYTSPHHLLPAYVGLAMLWVGAALCRQHLCTTQTAARQQ